jgi:hypothetical protein
VSNAEILGAAQRFATAAPIKECSNEALKIITGVRTVVNFRAKSRKMGICNPVSIHQGPVAQFTVDNQCFLGKMHDRHLKGSRYMLRREFPRHHFLKVRSTWWRLPVCSCACTISTLLFSCKMILFAMTEVLQVPQLEDSRLTSEATDG